MGKIFLPDEFWSSESGFRDEGVTVDLFKGLATWVRVPFVVPGGDPDFPLILDSHLGRPQNVTCGMKADLHTIQVKAFLILVRFHFDVLADPGPQQFDSACFADVLLMAPAGVIRMRMGDDGAIHRPMRIDVEVPPGAEETLRRPGD